MKDTLFLSDFLLIKDSLDPKLLDKAIDAYGNVKHKDDHKQPLWTEKIAMTLSLAELVQSLNDPNLHFDDDNQKINKVFEVVKVMYDLYYRGTGYYIKKVYVPNPSKKSLTTEN